MLSALTPLMSGGHLVGIDVQGTVQFSGGSHCTDISVVVCCGPVCVDQTVPLFMWTPTWGGFDIQFTNLPPGIQNCCGQTVSVKVGCPGCGYQTFLLPLNCDKKCPDLATLVCDVGPCQYNGSVQINCSAQITALNSYPSVTVQWEWNGNPVGSPVTLTAPGPVSTVITLPGGGQAVTVSLVVVSPANTCPPITTTVTLPTCQGCLPINISSTVGQCDLKGVRPVTITAVLTGGTPTTQISATMTGPCGTVTGSNAGVLNLTSSCSLGPGTYSVVVTAAGCHGQSYTFTVPECCPKITISHSEGDCHADDTRPVTITAVLTGASSAAVINATMSGPCGSVSQSGTGSVTLTNSCALSAGNYTVTVTPAGCPPQIYSFTVKQCCPKIAISHTVKDCNADGTRPVTITAVLTAGSATTSINATMTGPCGTISQVGTGTLTLTDQCDLNTGSYAVTVTPMGCPPQTYTFNVEDCCPKVDFKVEVLGDPICNDKHTRPVVITATVTPHNGVQTTATLVDSATGSTMASNSGSTTFTLTGTGDYTEGSHQVEVTFAAPLKCPPQTFQFCLPDCETMSCFNLRTLILIALTTFFAISIMNGEAALAAYLSTAPWWLFGRYLDFAPLSPTLSTIGNVAIIVALLALVWWRLCIKFLGFKIGACCWSCCIFRVLLWQVPLMVGICLLWFLAVCWSLNLVSALVLFLVSYLLFLWWRKKCCPGKCDVLFYLASALGAAAFAIVAIEFAGVSSHAVNFPNSVAAYIPWYVQLLGIVTFALRALILWIGYQLWLRWGHCK
jgi:hypothetical protein